jgi:L-seryl-tRNA(Ser) seleniumtransferase
MLGAGLETTGDGILRPPRAATAMTDYRIIPSIEHLRLRDGVRTLERDFGRAAIVAALREAAARLRAALAAGLAAPPDVESAAAYLEDEARQVLRQSARPSLRRVINATGVVVHTNLGRSPLSVAAVRRIGEVAMCYSNLEYDIAAGGRGHRDVHAEALLQRLLGVEAAVVVNNNAAAMLLVLAALAAGRDVIVSRGELVEIGGGFRVPEVMAQSGARLREVGTTNRTRLDDYRQAVGPDTALLLRVHRSNFRIEGFTEQPSLQELAGLGREKGIPVVEDIGSGYLGLPGEDADPGLDRLLAGEPRVQSSLEAGIDLVCFSGDKLLGGPQAGIIAGRRELVARVRRHPLMRALRVDKLTYAALEATLGEYVSGRASRTVPVLGMVLATPESLEARCLQIVERLAGHAGLDADIVDAPSAVGGGTTPGLVIPSRVIALRHGRQGADWLDAWLRQAETPVVGRIERDRLILDLRTVLLSEDEELGSTLGRVPA